MATIIAPEEAGIRVPDGIVVVGLDVDAPPRDYPCTPLTAHSQPLRETG